MIKFDAWTGHGDGVIELGYRGTGANVEAASVDLPPFKVPPGPENAVAVG